MYKLYWEIHTIKNMYICSSEDMSKNVENILTKCSSKRVNSHTYNRMLHSHKKEQLHTYTIWVYLTNVTQNVRSVTHRAHSTWFHFYKTQRKLPYGVGSQHGGYPRGDGHGNREGVGWGFYDAGSIVSWSAVSNILCSLWNS